jgi:hypothetical protein
LGVCALAAPLSCSQIVIPDGVGKSDRVRFQERLCPAPAATRGDQHGRSVPLTVVRSINRRWSEGKSVRACIEHRLSQTSRSPTRQAWV